MEKVLGIDLGTTYSCVSVVVDGSPKVIANKGGYRTTPSMVALAPDGKRLVGHLAKRQAVTNAKNTIFGAKRLIGRRYESDVVQQMKSQVPYTMAQGPQGDVRIHLGEKIYSLPEISSMVLIEMKQVAEEYLGEVCQKAVITVPAYFNDGQRQATKDAGRIAGLEVIRMINEPTAAALAYGYGREMEKRVVVFDLGGGTFDISVLDIGHAVYQVICTGGDTFLGGEDFDQRVADWITAEFSKEHQVEIGPDAMALQRIKEAAEKAKCELSFQNETEISLPFLLSVGKNKTYHFQRKLTRKQLEDLTLDLIERCVRICDKTLSDAGLKGTDINDVILVGGQTRMPRVQQMVKLYFGRDPVKSVHPDEAVALGAAIQGDSLLSTHKGKDETLLLDVTPHSLGIMIVGGYFQKLIEKNTTLPTSATRIFSTVKDSQTAVKIRVFQGESKLSSENELLGEFILDDLRAAPRGEVEVEVSFQISADGLVSVAAKDLDTGMEQSIMVTAKSSLNEEEIASMQDENDQHLVSVAQRDEWIRLQSEADALMAEIRKKLTGVQQILQGSGQEGERFLSKVQSVLDISASAIQEQDPAQMARCLSDLRMVSSTFQNLTMLSPAPRG